MGGAFHNRLGSDEFHVGVEARAKLEIPSTGKNIAEIAIPEFVIHFGVFAAGHVERVFAGCALDDVDFQRSLSAPGIFVRRVVF